MAAVGRFGVRQRSCRFVLGGASVANQKTDAFCVAAAGPHLDVMKRLLADGVDINAKNSRGDHALNVAATYGRVRTVKFLIDFGADLNLLDHFGMTPLMHACHSGKVMGSKIALLLIKVGADVRYVRSDGMTALKFAVESCPPWMIQTLIDCGADVDGPPNTEQTALMLAARKNNVESLKVLIKNGADIERKCTLPWANGATAEGLAIMEKRKAAAEYLRGVREAASKPAGGKKKEATRKRKSK